MRLADGAKSTHPAAQPATRALPRKTTHPQTQRCARVDNKTLRHSTTQNARITSFRWRRAA